MPRFFSAPQLDAMVTQRRTLQAYYSNRLDQRTNDRVIKEDVKGHAERCRLLVAIAEGIPISPTGNDQGVR